MPGSNDNRIIEGSLGEPEQFEEIYRRYRQDVFRFVVKRVGLSAAEDLTADVFVLAFRLRARYDPTREIARPWLCGLARNVVRDHLRSGRIDRRLLPDVWATWFVRSADPSSEATDMVAAQEAQAHLIAALREVSQRDRDALALVALGGLTYSEVAEVLSIPVGTVRSRISRARSRLRELMPEVAHTMGWSG